MHGLDSSPARRSLQPARTSLRPSIYATPTSPSTASSVHLGNGITSVGSRKRARPESPSSPPTRRTTTPGGLVTPYADGTDPAALANSRYRLAGGLDTPTAAIAAAADLDNCDSLDQDYRRRWSSVTALEGRPSYAVQGLERERNGKGRVQTSMGNAAQERESWSRYMFRVVGSVAGKVFDFWRPNGFQGFVAGGGHGYIMTAGETPSRVNSHRNWGRDLQNDRRDSGRGSTPVPGMYPVDDDPEEFSCRASPSPYEQDQQPASKRRQISQGSEWIVIARASAPTPTTAQYSISPSHLTSQHRSRVPRPVSQKTTRTVSLRRPSSQASSASFTGSTAPKAHSLEPLRTASYASPRSASRSEAHPQPELIARSPLSKSNPPAAATYSTPPSTEAARFAAARARQERQTDASVKRLNSQLKAMIKQGQEALASKVEVYDGVDRGYLDVDDYSMDESMIDEGYSEGYDGMSDDFAGIKQSRLRR